jgi:hypothetical protein
VATGRAQSRLDIGLLVDVAGGIGLYVVLGAAAGGRQVHPAEHVMGGADNGRVADVGGMVDDRLERLSGLGGAALAECREVTQRLAEVELGVGPVVGIAPDTAEAQRLAAPVGGLAQDRHAVAALPARQRDRQIGEHHGAELLVVGAIKLVERVAQRGDGMLDVVGTVSVDPLAKGQPEVHQQASCLLAGDRDLERGTKRVHRGVELVGAVDRADVVEGQAALVEQLADRHAEARFHGDRQRPVDELDHACVVADVLGGVDLCLERLHRVRELLRRVGRLAVRRPGDGGVAAASALQQDHRACEQRPIAGRL